MNTFLLSDGTKLNEDIFDFLKIIKRLTDRELACEFWEIQKENIIN